MSDREAFVQAIAANPADDLPRLVFADWLDEHGDPERAEFIRTQIRWHHTTDAGERKQLDARAADLFREHWQRWFGPFLLALDPHTELAAWSEFEESGHPAMTASLFSMRSGPLEPAPAATYVDVSRGFVSLLGVLVPGWRQPASLAQALKLEPPTELHCRNGLHSRYWNQFTDPVLRRVEWLRLTQQWAWGVSAPDSGALLSDPHLAGVRDLSVHTAPEANGETPPLPMAWMEAFTRSPLAYRLTGLCLPNIIPDGVTPLCRPGRLHLERLELGGELTAGSVRWLGASELAGAVRELRLNAAALNDHAAATLARAGWPKLSRLALQRNSLTAAVLPALAAAEFAPRLKALDLSGNPLFDGTDFRGLERLAEALDPDRLECLNLTDTGLSHVPDFLAERFGERVTM